MVSTVSTDSNGGTLSNVSEANDGENDRNISILGLC
jgi:hypothetical protein